jgi:hypothetical protein
MFISGARKLAYAQETTDTKWLYRDSAGSCPEQELTTHGSKQLAVSFMG